MNGFKGSLDILTELTKINVELHMLGDGRAEVSNAIQPPEKHRNSANSNQPNGWNLCQDPQTYLEN